MTATRREMLALESLIPEVQANPNLTDRERVITLRALRSDLVRLYSLRLWEIAETDAAAADPANFADDPALPERPTPAEPRNWESGMLAKHLGQLAILVGLLLASILSPLKASAQGEGPVESLGWGIRPANAGPAWFAFEMQPGESIAQTFELVNLSDDPRTLVVEPVAAITAQGGGLSFGERPNSVSGWLAFESGSYELGADDLRPLPFILTVPAETAPGEYVAAVVAIDAADLAADPSLGFGVQIIPRVAVPIMITVGAPGDCRIEIANASAGFGPSGDFATLLDLTNPGNVAWAGSGQAILTAVGASAPAMVQTFTVDSVLAGTSTVAPLYSPDPEPGAYVVRAELIGERPGCDAQIETAITITDAEIAKASEARERAESARPSLYSRITGDPLLLGAVLLGLVGLALLLTAAVAWWIGTVRTRRAMAARVRRRQIGPW